MRTEEQSFLGSLNDLQLVAERVDIPVLRKDFLLTEYDVWEARAAGADAVLLIACILELERLEVLISLAHHLQMSTLVEVHAREDLAKALVAGAVIVGINNRDLRTFQVDLAVTEQLRPLVPHNRLVVSESGVSTPADIQRLRLANVQAVLVGETLVRAEDPRASLKELARAGLLDIRC